jgi:hypothetical protein
MWCFKAVLGCAVSGMCILQDGSLWINGGKQQISFSPKRQLRARGETKAWVGGMEGRLREKAGR